MCSPFPLSTISCENKRTSIILLCLFIELIIHLHQLPADSTDYNKTNLLYSNHLSESASLTEDQTKTEGYSRMCQPDPFQELVGNLRRVLLTTITIAPLSPIINITNPISSPSVVASPLSVFFYLLKYLPLSQIEPSVRGMSHGRKPLPRLFR